ncbi:MAG: WS/DGAT/MGAT family O-acyltransferase [Nocardioidaceae bacterium]
MPDRLRPLDTSFLVMESASTPMHVATLDIFEAPDGLDYERVVALINDRIAFVPRYRQRVRWLPGRLGNPVWTDDEDFDLLYHVRRSALPRPGSMEQLRDLVARIMSRRLDRSRPLWETYLVEGLEGGRYAILSKSHQALVDGTTVDLGQLIVDDTPDAAETPDVAWTPERQRGAVELLGEAVTEAIRNPSVAADQLRGQVITMRSAAERALGLASGVTGRAPAHTGPLMTDLSEQRRFATVETRLADYRRVRQEHGGSVNDVILTTVAGAFRAWLLTRAESVSSATRIRALVPMSVVDDEFAEPTSLGSQVTPHMLSLPVGEASPVMRLHQVSYAFKAHKETGRAVAANKLAEIAGFAPTTLHAIGSRVAARHSPRSYQLLITNVPGPQFPLFAAGARMLASYPVQPLVPDHALAIGATSYDGKVFYGLHADRDAMPDLDVLAACIVEALDELVDASSSSRPRAPRGRVSPKQSQGVEGAIPQPSRRRTSSTSRATRSALAPERTDKKSTAGTAKTVAKKAAKKKDS